MIHRWVKIILLALLVLIQTACPTYTMKQSKNAPVQTPDDYSDSGHSGTG